MKTAILAAMLVFTTSCSSSSSRQHAQLASLVFDVPTEWHSVETHGRNVMTLVWTPDDNEQRKESITVIRTEQNPTLARAGGETVERLLSAAQGSLQGGHTSQPTPVTTKTGLSGFRVEVDYTPPGLRERYHRVHLVLIDGSALLHVMYTARTPDPELEALNMVLASIRHGELQS